MAKIVLMGVSGCGKSTVAAPVAYRLGAALVEGDDHHPAANQDKMRAGIALGDADRAPWLDRLGGLLAGTSGDMVLTCSALKRAYRDRLRAAEPAVRFVFVRIAYEDALARVAARPGHLFPPSLVRNQFDALEDPRGEPGVLAIEALWPRQRQCDAIVHWLADASASTEGSAT